MNIPPEVQARSNLIDAKIDLSKPEASLKPHQKPLTVKEQIENLKSIGLLIDCEEDAERVLNSVSYFRLIKAYGVGLKEKNGSFEGRIALRDLVALYDFDVEFRHLLIIQIETVEIAARCRIANYFCNKYGNFGYEDPQNFNDNFKHEEFIKEANASIGQNKRSPFVRNFQENYQGRKIPFYALVEILSFGSLSKCFKNMKPADKKEIAKTFKNNWAYLESWFETLAYVRNICAHYGRLYNIRLDKTPKMSAQDKALGVSTGRVFAALNCIRRLLPRDDSWVKFVNELNRLFLTYPQVKKEKMGFPGNWQEVLMS